MANVFVVPNWFFGYDILIEAIFAIITAFVSFNSYKIYKLCKERVFKLFSLAFLFFTLAYIVQLVFNLLILYDLNSKIMGAVNLTTISNLTFIELYIHGVLFIVGLLLLVYNSLKITDLKIFFLMLIILLVSIFFSMNKIFMIYVLSSLLLIYLTLFFGFAYFNNRKNSTLILTIAMGLLFIGVAHFIFAVNHGFFYVWGHFVELLAYGLIAVDLYLVLKHGKEACVCIKNGKKKR